MNSSSPGQLLGKHWKNRQLGTFDEEERVAFESVHHAEALERRPSLEHVIPPEVLLVSLTCPIFRVRIFRPLRLSPHTITTASAVNRYGSIVVGAAYYWQKRTRQQHSQSDS